METGEALKQAPVTISMHGGQQQKLNCFPDYIRINISIFIST